MADLYIKCPRCRGSCQVYAIIDVGADFRPSRGEYFSCPLCSGTGEADVEVAAQWVEDEEEFAP